MIAQLEPLGVLTQADVFAVAHLCDALAEWQKAAKGKGKPGEVDKAMRRAFTLYNRFGLTPADRTRLVAHPPGEEVDPLDELRARRERKAKAE